MATKTKQLSKTEQTELISVLKVRFEKNMNLHVGLDWNKVQAKLEAKPEELWSLNEMENSGGEPDVISSESADKTVNLKKDEYIFYDCSPESPKGRYNLCYDREALDKRKAFKPANSAMDIATEMGIDLISEEQYREMQKLGKFDTKTSSWLKTPADVRKLGGAIFGDRRFNTVFIYHNGADSYYAGRGFRGCLTV
jgi:hypothetical protein